jgi:hypothetical protein
VGHWDLAHFFRETTSSLVERVQVAAELLNKASFQINIAHEQSSAVGN